MQDNNEVQKAPAAPRREWVTPELQSLSLKSTLGGLIPWTYEGTFTDPNTGDQLVTHCDPSLSPTQCLS